MVHASVRRKSNAPTLCAGSAPRATGAASMIRFTSDSKHLLPDADRLLLRDYSAAANCALHTQLAFEMPFARRKDLVSLSRMHRHHTSRLRSGQRISLLSFNRGLPTSPVAVEHQDPADLPHLTPAA